ncbi:MAG: bifunctional hydroxymethylpyrimidine kinase/phosphomethylpyrimidine kinase [Rhodothermales bacterium]|nr:bifunctional hydroxymethylpyrimidine kinase/phosphomethylpyrimidine kinase [Rhodothermales bacterium]MDG2016729.1 bifunctional hydroxymethylpyrimidine kinase/phosphomethylpyrimidine kinase [Rhodothermales bacterium]
MNIPVALTIAGSDSGGGAGIQADIKSMQANGVFAASVITAVTSQNTVAVTDAMDLPVSIIASQLDAVMSDLPVAAAKTGMLSSVEIIECVSQKVAEHTIGPLVVDPVMISKSGFPLLKDDAVDALIKLLLPLAEVCTPNAHEAARLVGYELSSESDAAKAAEQIFEMGPRAVLVKGGHLDAEEDAVDVLFDGSTMHVFRTPRIETVNTHGTGCTYAATIAANLARRMSIPEAVEEAKIYVTQAILHGLSIGKGHGPTDHFYFLRD